LPEPCKPFYLPANAFYFMYWIAIQRRLLQEAEEIMEGEAS